jgi:diguanylate cyclase (GGDEF)-like protein/PAS domain S-box-containing protein
MTGPSTDPTLIGSEPSAPNGVLPRASDDGATERPPRQTWLLAYFALAGLDLLTVLLGLYLGHTITQIYSHSIAINQQWVQRLSSYDELRRLAGAVNAPGSNIFDSRSVAAERAALRIARADFDSALDAATRELRAEASSRHADQLVDDLAGVHTAVDGMAAEAERIFAHFERGDMPAAGRRMAAMDRKYHRVQDTFTRLTNHVQTIQTEHLADQIAAAETVHRFKWLIAALIVLMVAGATTYGHYLIKRAALAARRRDHARRLDAKLQSEQTFRALVEHGSDIILMSDRTLVLRYASPSTTRVLGREPDTLVGRPLVSLIHPEDIALASEHCRRALDAPGVRFSLECRIQHADGSWRTVEVVGHSAAHLPFAAADAAQLILNARDTTERREAVRAVEASEERYRGLVETMHDLVAEMSPEGALRFVNPALCLVTQYSESELIGSNFFSYLHPDDLAQTAHHFERLREHRQPIRHYEYRFRRRDGSYLHLVTNSDPIGDDDGRLKSVVQVCFDLTRHKQAEATIRKLAYHDPLTGLPNRALLIDRLTEAIQGEPLGARPIALVVLDIDHFKDINNTLGHHHGDVLLGQLAARLTAMIRQSDVVARLGGDEFALLLPDTTVEGAVLVDEKIRAALADPFDVEALAMTIEASIGVAVFPDHAASPDALLQRANVAMYAAKENRSGLLVYASEHDHYNPWRLALTGELRFAIEHDELVLFFQPKVHMPTRRVIGVEALVRWKHPHRGMIPPDEFIPMAEHTGLIRSLTRRVLTAARAEDARLKDAGYRLTIAVNLSARTLLDATLADFITTLLTPGQLPWLELEITESAIMADPARALGVLGQLHAMKIPLAIDDFGTGYSSLAYLKKLPVGALKIDKSFIKNLAGDENDAAIVRSTIEMGHHLGLAVVAEGVESGDAWNHLAQLGCDAAQGYYISRPMSDRDLDQWLRQGGWDVARSDKTPSARAA